MEAEGWDSHHHVRSDYSPGYEQPHDMHHPLSHYFISGVQASCMTAHHSHLLLSASVQALMHRSRHGQEVVRPHV
jgi:hypothetical protein